MRTSSFLLISFLAVAACGGSVSTSDGTGTPSPTGQSGNSSDGAEKGESAGAGAGATSSPSDGSNCHYEEVHNPPECPATYKGATTARCSPVGLKCWYPGVGDGMPDGCYATALLACVADGETDGGTDGGDGGAGTGSWRAAQ
jgi:hypothetical protein